MTRYTLRQQFVVVFFVVLGGMVATLTFPITTPAMTLRQQWMVRLHPIRLVMLALVFVPAILWWVFRWPPEREQFTGTPSVTEEWVERAVVSGIAAFVATIVLIFFCSATSHFIRQFYWSRHIEQELDAVAEELMGQKFTLIGVEWSNLVETHYSPWNGGRIDLEIAEMVVAFVKDEAQVRLLFDQGNVTLMKADSEQELRVTFPDATWWEPKFGATSFAMDVPRAVIYCTDPANPPTI